VKFDVLDFIFCFMKIDVVG